MKEKSYLDVVKRLREQNAVLQSEFMEKKSSLSFQTICTHGMHGRKEGHLCQSIRPTLAQSSSAPFLNNNEAAAILSYDAPGYNYTRIINPTNYELELLIAMLHGYKMPFRTSALLTSSGMAAIAMAVLSLVKNGDNIVSSNRVYGGTFQFFNEDLKDMGVQIRWVKNPSDLEEWDKLIDSNTKLLFVESPSNPLLYVADIEKLAYLARENTIPLIVDNTMASPVLFRPLEHGADIVVESTSKIFCGSGRIIGGVLVSKNNITTKDNRSELREDFACFVRCNKYRNMGPAFSPYAAQIMLDEILTLPMRVRRQSQSALQIAQFLENHPTIEKVNYPGLIKSSSYENAVKYLKLVDEDINAFGFMLSFEVKGTINAAASVCEYLEIGHLATDLGKSVTIFIHPASTTHYQLGQEERKKAGISDTLIRYSVGLEDPKDIIADLAKALAKI